MIPWQPATLVLALKLAALGAPLEPGGFWVLPPPAQYDVPWTGELTEQVLPLEEVPPTCNEMGTNNRYAWGCQRMLAPRHCLIVIPKVGRSVSAFLQKEIRRHELAHCNGWRH
jgi:hypothetical protein